MKSRMLKISVQDEPHRVTLKLEGSVAGTWVVDLEDSWRATKSKLAGRPLFVHLDEVAQVDNAGRYLLALLRYSGVQLTAEGIMTTDLIRTIAEDWPIDPDRTYLGGSQQTRKMPKR